MGLPNESNWWNQRLRKITVGSGTFLRRTLKYTLLQKSWERNMGKWNAWMPLSNRKRQEKKVEQEAQNSGSLNSWTWSWSKRTERKVFTPAYFPCVSDTMEIPIDLRQGSANCDPWADSVLPTIFINTVMLEQSLPCVYVSCMVPFALEHLRWIVQQR